MFGRRRNGPWLNNVRNAFQGVANAADDFFHNNNNNNNQNQNRGGAGGGGPWGQGGFPFHPHHFQQQQQPPPPESSQRTPVASTKAIRQLPTIRVQPEDLVDPSNRECCICLEENKLGDRVTRLPCAHIFHSYCVVDWLANHSCTCPVCRYELATDDPQYEAGRMERMKTRKPRFAIYELQRMSVPQLLKLFRTPPPRGMLCEKSDLIQKLIDEDRIDLIRAPKPVEYKLQDLQTMRPSELKRVMADAGVFFHAYDVVEKMDMITIFINSGRLNLLLPSSSSSSEEDNSIMEIEEVNNEDEGEESKMQVEDSGCPSSDIVNDSYNKTRVSQKRPLVETVNEEGQDCEMMDNNPTNNIRPIEMFNAENSSDLDGRLPVAEALSIEGDTQQNSNHSSLPDDIGNDNNNGNEEDLSKHEPAVPSEDGSSRSDLMSIITNSNAGNKNPAEVTDTPDGGSSNNNEIQNEGLQCTQQVQSEISSDVHTATSGNLEAFNEGSLTPPSTTEAVINDGPDSNATAFHSAKRPSGVNDYSLGESTRHPADDQFGDLSISELRSMCRAANIDSSQCCERSQLIDLLRKAGIVNAEISREDLSIFNVSQLRALSSVVRIDLSHSLDYEEMIDKILYEVNNERKYLRTYLRALAPLAVSSVSELRGISRAWGVNINDCLEKEEMINRLIREGPAAGRR